MLVTTAGIARSEGHIAFAPDTHGGYWEYYLVGSDIYRQTTGAPVMPDGRRSGRWYAPARKDIVSLIESLDNPGLHVQTGGRERVFVPSPDYSDRPTLIVGVDDEGNTYGVEAVAFSLPDDVRIVYRNYSHGPAHDEPDGLGYEDAVVD